MCLSVCNNVCVCVSACVPRSHCLHLGACVQLPAWTNRSVLLFFCCCHFISFSPSTPYCLLALTHVLSHTLSHTRALTHALSHTHTHKLSLFVPPSSGFLPTCWTVPVPLVPTVITIHPPPLLSSQPRVSQSKQDPESTIKQRESMELSGQTKPKLFHQPNEQTHQNTHTCSHTHTNTSCPHAHPTGMLNCTLQSYLFP